MKLSQHGKIRMRERTNLNHKERKVLFRKALDYGLSINNIKDGAIKDYLKARENNCKIKLYNNYVFIYSKNGKQLYTMYKLPDNLL